MVPGDIVMLTDRMCGVSDRWKKWFAEERRLHELRSAWTEPLSELCKGKVCAVQDLVTGSDVRNVFRAI